LNKESQDIIPKITLKKRLSPELTKQSSVRKNTNYQEITIRKNAILNDNKTIHMSKNEAPSPKTPEVLKED
jgi:hypothetical protein